MENRTGAGEPGGNPPQPGGGPPPSARSWHQAPGTPPSSSAQHRPPRARPPQAPVFPNTHASPPPPTRGPAQGQAPAPQGSGQHWPNPKQTSWPQPAQRPQPVQQPQQPQQAQQAPQPHPQQWGRPEWHQQQWEQQQWGHQQWGAPQGWPPPPRRDRGRAVLTGAFVAASVALVALIASVTIVVNTPQEEPSAGGGDVSVHYDVDLYAQPEPVDVDLIDHPLYDVAMPEPIDCPLPSLTMDSDESWEEFAGEAGECLNELWAPVMDELGLVPELPEITVSDESLDTDTQDSFTLAYYESDLGRITVVLPNVREVGAQIPAAHQEDVWLALMGHEYAHHVQYATGILTVSHDLRRTAGSEADELDTLRRTELQAECMAGVGLRGLTDPDGNSLEVVNEHFNGGGDLETHGSAANRSLWLESGWESETVGGCNTYEAQANQVS